MGFFYILHEEYMYLLQELVVIEITEWKLKAKIARNNI